MWWTSLLAAGHEVRVLDVGGGWRNPAAEYLTADLFDPAALVTALAGATRCSTWPAAANVNEVAADPVAAVRLNVEGTARVLDAARAGGCGRVLLASTVWVYGAARGRGRAGRGHAGRPAPGRARLRRHQARRRMLVHSYREMYGQQFTILRYGIPYGPRMRDELVVARFVRAALDGQPITIAGTGEQQRNYVYVEDLADAHVRALDPAAEDQTLALEGAAPVSVREIADTVRELVRPVPVEFVPARTADYQGVSVSGARGQGTAGLGPGHPVRRGRAPVPGMAEAGQRQERPR